MARSASVSVVKSGPRRNIGSFNGSRAFSETEMSTQRPQPTEIDNHADTHCFGGNFRPVTWTNVQCSVSPFLDELGSTENIDICTAATAWMHPSGETLLLVFGQGLWFGPRMKKSLINPNQCRAYGISVCDDPTDPHRELGIYDKDSDTFISMVMNGSFCSMLTRCPTPEEMDRCRRIYLSSEDMWDPNGSPFGSTLGEFPAISDMRRQLDERVVCAKEGVHPLPTNKVPTTASEYDTAMLSISPALCHGTFVQRVVSSSTIPSTAPPTVPRSRTRISPMDSAITKDRHHPLTPASLAKKFGIGLACAKQTLKVTTQLGTRSAIHPLSRRYRTDFWSNRHRRLNTTVYTDTFFSKTKSVRQNVCAQIYTSGENYYYVHPMRDHKKLSLADSLQHFVDDVGVPHTLFSDGANEMLGKSTPFSRLCHHYRIAQRHTEPYSPWQNKAERGIGHVKRRWKRRMIRRRVPKQLWDYGVQYEAEILSRIASGKDGRTGIERFTGDTADISEWADFSFYDICWFWNHPAHDENPQIGRWLGVAHEVGSAMCYWILTSTGKVVSRTTVQHLTDEDVAKAEIQKRLNDFHTSIEQVFSKHGDCYAVNGDQFDAMINDTIPDDEAYAAHEEEVRDVDEILENGDTDADEADCYNGYINAEIHLKDADGNVTYGRVTKRARHDDGTPIGRTHPNPFLDSSEYIVEHPDGTCGQYAANVIAENLFTQVDTEGNRFQVLKEIQDHRSDGRAITRANGWNTSRNGNKTPKLTTIGWQLLVEWKTGGTEWVPLKALKQSNPIELAEYAVANNIQDEPAFRWWVPHTLRTRERIISKVKSRYWVTTHKFGIKLPKTVQEALQIDKKTGTDFWKKAIQKEMSNVRVAFKRWENGTVADAKSGQGLPAYQRIKCHMIFDIKMDGKFTRKARFVAGGHTTDPPSSITYSSVVSRDSVRIAFMLAALNDLDLSACDIGNAYLNAPCREKIWTEAGPEFEEDEGSVMLVVRALYGLKSSGAAWRAMFAQTLTDLQYTPSKADPDVWIKPAVKPDGTEYYAMILVYVDDCLHVHHDTKPLMDRLNQIYRLKEEPCEPDRYLGANIKKFIVGDTVRHAMCCTDYVNSAIANLEKTLATDGEPDRLSSYSNKSCKRPFPLAYRPECDTSPELSSEMGSRYLQLIGILRWAVELGRLDIYTEVSILSQHQCLPREGHLDAIYRIFAYLKRNKHESRIIFDPTRMKTDEKLFCNSQTGSEVWKDFYPDAEEALPPKMPRPRGIPVKISCFVDADHAANRITRRSHTGIIIYCQNTPVVWFSKRQNTCESSSFSSELVALRIATEMIAALRYKLRMFGVPIDGPADIFCDNQSVANNASVPTSMLNKKHNAICYHVVREAQASGAQRVAWINGEYNQADILTKTTLGTDKKYGICHELFGWGRTDITPFLISS